MIRACVHNQNLVLDIQNFWSPWHCATVGACLTSCALAMRAMLIPEELCPQEQPNQERFQCPSNTDEQRSFPFHISCSIQYQ